MNHRTNRRKSRIPCCRRSRTTKKTANSHIPRCRKHFCCSKSVCLLRRTAVHIRYFVRLKSRNGCSQRADVHIHRTARSTSRSDCSQRADVHIHDIVRLMCWSGCWKSLCAHIRCMPRVRFVCRCHHNHARRRNRSAPRRKMHRLSRTRFWVGPCCAARRPGSLGIDRCPSWYPPLGKGRPSPFEKCKSK